MPSFFYHKQMQITQFDPQYLSDFEIFNHEIFGNIHTLTDENGQIWFYANDICNALGYKNTKNHNTSTTVSEHVKLSSDIMYLEQVSFLKSVAFNSDATKFINDIWPSNKDHNHKIFISEYGMYALVMGSKMDTAGVNLILAERK